MAFPHARRRRPVLLLFAVFLLGFLMGAPVAVAEPLPTGTVGGFEDDGNMVTEPEAAGTLDWDTVKTTTVVGVDDTLDSGLQGSSKENEPENFTCNTGGDNPPKNDLLRAYVNVRMTGSGTTVNSAYLDLAYVRDKGEGDAHVNFEFNQNEITNPCPHTGRTEGDLLVVFDFPGGAGAATVNTLYWDADAGDGGLGDWVDVALEDGKAAGASNSDTITDSISGGSIGARKFGEATIDMVALDKVVPGDVLDCPGFGFVNIRSRSSGESFNSALQDRMPPTPVDLSTCGSVKIGKTDDAGKPVAEAEFGLFDNENATGDPVYTCTSGADGLCVFADVEPGSYWIREIAAPPGYEPDDDIVAVTVGFRESVDLTAEPFVNKRVPSRSPSPEPSDGPPPDEPGLPDTGADHARILALAGLGLITAGLTMIICGDRHHGSRARHVKS